MRVKKFAKLFEAGDYPDKGVNVTQADLDRIVAGFQTIPVKIEHTDTVFDGAIGAVTAVFTDAGSLYGSIEFEEDLWPVINKLDAKKLSVGIRSDLGALTEVSIVREPRVADARVFSFSAEFADSYEGLRGAIIKALGDGRYLVDFTDTAVVYRDANGQLWKSGYRQNETGVVELGTPAKVKIAYIEDEAPDTNIPYSKKEEDVDKNEEMRAQNEALRAQVGQLEEQIKALRFSAKESAVDAKLNEMITAGKITPAGKDLARAIMLQGGEEVTFAGNKESVADLFCRFVETMPKAPETGKVTVLPDAKEEEPGVTFSAEELKVLKGLGADPERIAKTIKKGE